MLTKKDLEIRFRTETGNSFEKHTREYYLWVEEKYIELLNDLEEEDKLIGELFMENDFIVGQEKTESIDESLHRD